MAHFRRIRGLRHMSPLTDNDQVLNLDDQEAWPQLGPPLGLPGGSQCFRITHCLSESLTGSRRAGWRSAGGLGAIDCLPRAGRKFLPRPAKRGEVSAAVSALLGRAPAPNQAQTSENTGRKSAHGAVSNEGNQAMLTGLGEG